MAEARPRRASRNQPPKKSTKTALLGGIIVTIIKIAVLAIVAPMVWAMIFAPYTGAIMLREKWTGLKDVTRRTLDRYRRRDAAED